MCTHCGKGNTVAKIDYLTLTMHIFSAVRLIFWFYIFIVIYKFFLHLASLMYEEISEHIFVPDNAILETYTVQEQCRKIICRAVGLIYRIKILNPIDYRVKRIIWTTVKNVISAITRIIFFLPGILNQ